MKRCFTLQQKVIKIWKRLLSLKFRQATCLSKDTGCENKDICLFLTSKMHVKFLKKNLVLNIKHTFERVNKCYWCRMNYLWCCVMVIDCGKSCIWKLYQLEGQSWSTYLNRVERNELIWKEGQIWISYWQVGRQPSHPFAYQHPKYKSLHRDQIFFFS